MASAATAPGSPEQPAGTHGGARRTTPNSRMPVTIELDPVTARSPTDAHPPGGATAVPLTSRDAGDPGTP